MIMDNNIKAKVFSGLFWKFGERIIAQLVTFCVSVVLARLIAPSEYGTIALVMVFISIADVFVTSGFGNALIQKKNADNIDFSSVFYFNIVFSIIVYFVLCFSAHGIAIFYGNVILEQVIKVLGLRIPIAAINSVQQAYVSRNMLFKRFFWSTLFGTLLSGFIGIAMAYQGYGVWALVGQYLTNTIVDTTILWLTVRWRPTFCFSFSRVKVLFSYGWKLLCAGLLDTGYSQLRNLVIGKAYSADDLAFYNKGEQLPNLLVVNINTSISSVLFPAIASQQDNSGRVKAMTRRAIKISSYIMWPAIIGLCVIAQPLIDMLLTEKWLESVQYLQIISFSYVFWPIHTANLEAIKAMGRSDLFFKLEIVKKIIGIIVLIIAIPYGVKAIACSAVLASALSTFINAYPNRKLLNYSYREQFRDIFPSIVLASIMGGLIYPIKFIKLSNMFRVSLQVMLGAVIYMVASYIAHNDSYNYIKGILRSVVASKKGK